MLTRQIEQAEVKIEDDQKIEIREYKYSDSTIKNYISWITRSYPISRLSVDASTEVLRLLADALKILDVRKIDSIGDIQASTSIRDIYSAETVASMTSTIYNSYKDAKISAGESTKILDYLVDALILIYDHFSVPFSYKDIEYNFADMDNEDEIDEIINLLADTFSKEDKQKCLELSFAEVKQYIELHIKEEINDKNVIVAKDEDGKMIGALSWMDFSKDFNGHQELVSSKYAPNFALWKILKDSFREFYRKVVGEEIREGDVVYLKTAAVNRLLMEKVLNRDIGNIFYLFSVFLSFRRGYKACYGAEASEISHYLSVKYGGIALDKIVYEDFIFEGQKPFKNIYAKTPKKDSIYKSIGSMIGFADPYHMEVARELIEEVKK